MFLENLQNALGKLRNALGKPSNGGSIFGPHFGTAKRGARKDLLAPILDPFLDETCLEIPLGPARRRSRAFFLGSKGFQERSKWPKEGLRQPPRTEEAI